jgi:hypothetical protein
VLVLVVVNQVVGQLSAAPSSAIARPAAPAGDAR